MLAGGLLAAVAVACQDGTVLHQYRPVPSTGWDKRDTVNFDLPPVLSTQTYNVVLGLRTTTEFPYQRLWLVVEQRLEQPARMRRDTVSCVIATPQGAVTGKGVNLYQHEIPLFTETLQEGQHGTLHIYHIMRREDVPGVNDVGIKITKSGGHP